MALEEVAADLNAINLQYKEMGENLAEEERNIRKMKQQNEIVVKASTIIEQNEDTEEKIEEINEEMKACRDENAKAYAQIVKKKDKITKSIKQDSEKRDLNKEVKDVIRKNTKFVRDIFDRNKSNILHGVKEKE